MWREDKKLSEAAQLLARGQLRSDNPDDQPSEDEVAEALAAWGLKAEGNVLEQDEVFALWPENLPVFELWKGIQTQWYVGMGGATGLNYAGVESYMSMRGVRKKDRAALLAGVQVMEFATLDVWDRNKK